MTPFQNAVYRVADVEVDWPLEELCNKTQGVVPNKDSFSPSIPLIICMAVLLFIVASVDAM
jgi:hypothetical protein